LALTSNGAGPLSAVARVIMELPQPKVSSMTPLTAGPSREKNRSR